MYTMPSTSIDYLTFFHKAKENTIEALPTPEVVHRLEALIVRFQIFDFQMQSFVPLFGVAIIFSQQFQDRNLGLSINDVSKGPSINNVSNF